MDKNEKEEAQELNAEPYVEFRSSRSTLSQVLATMAQSMLLFTLGMMISSTTVIIGSLHNSPSGFSLTDRQASWLAGLMMVSQPLGSLLSGSVQDAIGRKKCMLLVNVPQLAGWLLIYSASTVSFFYAGFVLMGFSIGFMEAPTLSYVGEIAQPHLRGILASSVSTQISVGMLFMYLLGTYTHWRTALAISSVVPVLTFIAILQVPESPNWLLMKGKVKEAKAALAWLRGWVTEENVTSEFARLSAHIDSCQRFSNGGTKLTVWERLKDLGKPDMVKPLATISIYFMFLHCAALNGSKPFLVKIFREFDTSVDPFFATVIMSLSQIFGSIACMILIQKTGKRRLSLISILMCSIIISLLGTYTCLYQSTGYTVDWLPVSLFVLLYFFQYVGIAVVPWCLLSEIFPQRHRGVGAGISAATYYLWFFVATKTFLDLENLIGLSAVFFFYAFMGLIGFVFLSLCLPETEGRSLKELEGLYSGKMTNIHPKEIRIIS